MSEKRVYILALDRERRQAMADVANAPSNFCVEVKPTKRTELQSRKFHAMAGDIAKAGVLWNKKARTRIEWKVLLISGHAIATGQGAEVVAGLEGELVNIRESSADMSMARKASLIEYTKAFGDMNGVAWSEPLDVDSPEEHSV